MSEAITPPQKLVLGYNTNEWAGTFQLVLEALIIDLLTDDEPVSALIRWTGDQDGRQYENKVLITKYHTDTQRVEMSPGILLGLDRIYYIEV